MHMVRLCAFLTRAKLCSSDSGPRPGTEKIVHKLFQSTRPMPLQEEHAIEVLANKG